MKKRSTSRISLKTKVRTNNKVIVAAVSLSLIITICGIAFFYFKSSDDALAAGKHPHRPSRTLGLFEKKVTCKPKNGYKKGKISKSNADFSKNAYTYVYASASAAPPRNTTKTFAPVGGTTSEKEELKAPATKVAKYSWLKDLSVEERDKKIKDLTPSSQLPPIRFITDKDEFSVVNMDLIMNALEQVNQGKLILVEGHTDDVGTSVYNHNLSVKRVEKIKQLLLQAGADPNLISLAGYGEERPLVENINDENRQINRRIEIKVFDL